MALVTTDQAALGFLNIFSSGLWENRNRLPRGGRLGFRHKYTLAAAQLNNADDSTRLLLLPAGFAIMDAVVYFVDEADTGSVALVWDLITEQEDGTDDSLKLISASQAGRSAGEASRIDAAAVGVIYSEPRFITFDVTTAAGTAAEADIYLTLDLQYGILTPNVGPALKLEAV